MNYQRIYSEITSKAKERVLKGYKERHHITPKCIGGTNEKSNIVELTAREHFLCHWLLIRMYPDNRKLAHAFWLMCNEKRDYQERIVPSSRAYSEARQQVVRYLTNRIVAQETRDKLAKATSSNWTEERRQKHIQRNKDRIFTKEHRENMSKALSGKTQSLESNIKRSQKLTGVKKNKNGELK